MSTIMAQGNSDGTRRCDGTCHKAQKGTKCTCICGGRYHGCGNSEAAQELLTEDWLGKDWKEQKAKVEAEGGNYAEVVSKAIDDAVRNGVFNVPVRVARTIERRAVQS